MTIDEALAWANASEPDRWALAKTGPANVGYEYTRRNALCMETLADEIERLRVVDENYLILAKQRIVGLEEEWHEAKEQLARVTADRDALVDRWTTLAIWCAAATDLGGHGERVLGRMRELEAQR